MNRVVQRSMLARGVLVGTLVSATFLLAGCGGGGNSMVRPEPPPPAPPPPPPAQTYDPAQNQLIPTGAHTAQAEGFTGKGVRVGIMGFGVDPTTPPLNGRIAWFKSYLPGGNQSPNDTTGHGTVVADILGGLAAGMLPADSNEPFPGGVAPEAGLYVEQVCAATGNPPCTWNSSNYNDFVSEQVRVINESLGMGDAQTQFSGPNDPNIPIVQAVYQPAVNAGILQVWCVGNDGHTQPWNQAGLPYWIPSFQPDWLAVVNIAIDGNGNPAGLSNAGNEPSNACGVAAEWCLGAPGDVMIPTPNVPGTVFQGEGFGSSFATAAVSGVAAQVFQAFPWMTAANVSDTILTTATPLGGSAPNATYGWGMVNAAKAVDGPAQFAFPQFGPFTADIPGGITSTFSNAISGPGGLKLTGPGTLILSATDTYLGGSEIAAGTLSVVGSVKSNVTVDTAGTLTGSGTVSADVANNGTVVSVGTKAAEGLTIAGNLTDGSSSTTAVALGDPLQVNGTASVAGTMNVLGAPTGYTVKSNETLLNADVVSGTFGNLTLASGVFYTGTLGYTPTQVNIALTQTNVQNAAEQAMPLATAQTITSARHVQGALNVSNLWFTSGKTDGHEAWFQAAGRFLAVPDAAIAVASLNSLSGEIYATGRAVETEQSLATDSAIANRDLALSRETRPGVWVQALGADGTLARAGYDDATYRSGGTLAGFDWKIIDGLMAGLAAGRTHTDATMTALGGSIDGRESVAAAYARWNASDGWYVSGRVSYANVRNGVQRDILLGTTLTSLADEHNDRVTLATVEGGKSFIFGDATLTPYATVSDLHIQQPGFTEQGSAMGLAAPSQTHDASLAAIGLRYGTGFDWSLGHSFLEGYGAYRRVFSGDDLGMAANFNRVPDSSFVAEGQNLPINLGIVGMHLNTQMNQRWSWFIDADYQTGSEGAHQAEADAGIRVSL